MVLDDPRQQDQPLPLPDGQSGAGSTTLDDGGCSKCSKVVGVLDAALLVLGGGDIERAKLVIAALRDELAARR